MPPNPAAESTSAPATASAPVSRRTLFIGAGTAGALAAAASALKPPATAALPAAAALVDAPAPEGYRLSDHVKRYYKTARV